jgi:DNA-directed RNA polymerase II subunit RPB1
MTSIKFNEQTNSIDKIEFCIFGNDEIKRYSAISKDIYGITLPETTDESGKPKKGGLNDPRLGITDYTLPCATCGLDMDGCQGHIGHAELPEPAFHLGFISYVKILLSCVCIRCSNLLINKTDDELQYMLKNFSFEKRFLEVKRLSQNIKKCERTDVGCGKPVPKIKEEKNKKTAKIQIIAELDETDTENNEEMIKVKEYLTAERIYEIFKNINDLDAQILGINTKNFRPDDLIHKNLVIPPVAIRPSSKLEALGSSYEDMMTHKLVDIVKGIVNRRKQKEKKLIGGEGKYDADSQHLLQYHIGTYFDNDSLALPKAEQKTGNRASKSVSERLKGKHGRVRGNLLGKRFAQKRWGYFLSSL